jgi:colanic acid biosynthesis protein WcaH
MIENELYNKMVENLPILCVDGFIISNGKILLLKRNNKPAQGQWWVPGGRVLKNEKLENAILRKIKDETNLDVKIIEILDICETIFENKHTVNICYLLSTDDLNIKLNSEHSEYIWFELEKLPELDHRILKIIKKISNYENINS